MVFAKVILALGLMVSSFFLNAKDDGVKTRDNTAFDVYVKSYLKDIDVRNFSYKNGELTIRAGITANRIFVESGLIALEMSFGAIGLISELLLYKLVGAGCVAAACYNVCDLVTAVMKSKNISFVIMNSEGIKFYHKPFVRWDDIQSIETETGLFKRLMFNLNYDLELFSIKETDLLCSIHFETLVLLVNHYYKQFGPG